MGGRRKRGVCQDVTSSERDGDHHVHRESIKEKKASSSVLNGAGTRTDRVGSTMLVISVSVLAMGIYLTTHWYNNNESDKKSIFYYGILVCSLFPVFLCLLCALQRNKSIGQRLISMSLVLAVICSKLPRFICAGIFATGMTLFALMTRPRQGEKLKSVSNDKDQQRRQKQAALRLKREGTPSEKEVDDGSNKSVDAEESAASEKRRGLTKAGLSVLVMVAVLVFENFMIWVVSATFEPGHNAVTAPPPLQDNGRLVLAHVLKSFSKREVIALRRIWNVEWALCSTFSTSVAVVEMHPRRQVWAVCLRGALSLAAARFIRTVSFLLTVLPSQNKSCYSQHFPNPPPEDTWEWIKVGFLPASSGGCNDLIISGHACVTSVLACATTSVADDPLFSVALWWLLAQDYMVEVYEGFHYSVDMWMGAILLSLFWRVLKIVEPEPKGPASAASAALATASDTTNYMSSLYDISKKEIILYFVPALIGYLQIAAFPESWVIPIVLIYCLCLLIQISLHGVKHYTQHQFFVMLYIALGIFM